MFLSPSSFSLPETPFPHQIWCRPDQIRRSLTPARWLDPTQPPAATNQLRPHTEQRTRPGVLAHDARPSLVSPPPHTSSLSVPPAAPARDLAPAHAQATLGHSPTAPGTHQATRRMRRDPGSPSATQAHLRLLGAATS